MENHEPDVAPSSPKRAKQPAVLRAGIYVLIAVAAGVSMYLWQHRYIQSSELKITNLNQQVSDLKKSNSKLTAENKRLADTGQAVSQSASQPDDTTPKITPSTLTITGVKLVPVSTYISSQPPPQGNWLQYTFTIKNNSDKTQAFALSGQGNNEIRGISKTGEVVTPQGGAGSTIWTGATVTAGGTVEGATINFLESDQIVKLQWKAPDATGAVEIPVPSL